jgi:hypothetical protein
VSSGRLTFGRMTFGRPVFHRQTLLPDTLLTIMFDRRNGENEIWSTLFFDTLSIKCLSTKIFSAKGHGPISVEVLTRIGRNKKKQIETGLTGKTGSGVVKRFSWSPTPRQNKLECLSVPADLRFVNNSRAFPSEAPFSYSTQR